MKKLLTLILPALALTTGAPQAEDGDQCHLASVHCISREQLRQFPYAALGRGIVEGTNEWTTQSIHAISQEHADQAVLDELRRRNVILDTIDVAFRARTRCIVAVTPKYDDYHNLAFGKGDNEDAATEDANADCQNRYGEGGAPPKQAAAAEKQEEPRYGAYAAGTRDGEKMAYALAVGYETQDEADAAAVERCNENPGLPGCGAVSVIDAPCAAVAKVNDGQNFGQVERRGWDPGIGAGENEAGAIATAISKCQAQPKIGEGILYCSKHSAVCAPPERHASIRGRLDRPGEEAQRDLHGYIENLLGPDAAPAEKEAAEITETFNENVPEIFKKMSELYGNIPITAPEGATE